MESNLDNSWRVRQATPEEISEKRHMRIGFFRALKQHGLYETYENMCTEAISCALFLPNRIS